MKPTPGSSQPAPLPPDIVEALADALATALVSDLQQGEEMPGGQSISSKDDASRAERQRTED